GAIAAHAAGLACPRRGASLHPRVQPLHPVSRDRPGGVGRGAGADIHGRSRPGRRSMTAPATTAADPLAAALAYAARGWPVLPLHTATATGCSCRDRACGSPAKHPRTMHGLRDATTDP